MVTTAASPSVGFIHDRMMAVPKSTDAEEYLGRGDFRFSPFTGPLSIHPRKSPLANKICPAGPRKKLTFRKMFLRTVS
jgi:hypothetical protein